MSSFVPSTEVVASFTDTLREQDEIFYAAFPQARDAGDCGIVNSSSNGPQDELGRCLFPHSLPQSWLGDCMSPSGSCNVDECLSFHTLLASQTNSSYSPLPFPSVALSEDPLESNVAKPFSRNPGSIPASLPTGIAAPTMHAFTSGEVQKEYREPLQERTYSFLSKRQSKYDNLPIRSKLNKSNPDRKPALACLFCRGRKIACGPPITVTREKTCGQCQRRSLTCVYPSESRRGMRKRREPTMPTVITSSPNPS